MGIQIGLTPKTSFSLNRKIRPNLRAGNGASCSHPPTVCGIAPSKNLQIKHIIMGRSCQTSCFRILSTGFVEIRELGYRNDLAGGGNWAVKCASSDGHELRYEGGDRGGGGDNGRRGTGGNDNGGDNQSIEGSQWWWLWWLLFKQWVLPLFLSGQNLQGKSNSWGVVGKIGSDGFDWDLCCSKLSVMLVEMTLCGAGVVPLPVVCIAGAVGILNELLKLSEAFNEGLVACFVACGMAFVTATGGLGWLMWKLLMKGHEDEDGDENMAQEEECCIDEEG